MTRVFQGIVLAVWLAGPSLVGQIPRAEPPADWTYSGTDPITIPFELNRNHVVIPVLLNGQEFPLILDTGMPIPGVLLWDSPKVRELDLRYTGQARLGGAGGDGGSRQFLEARTASGLQLKIKDLELLGERATVAPLENKLGSLRYHEGVIGLSIFRRFVVEVDYEQSQIRLHRPSTFLPPADSSRISLEVRGYPFTWIDATMPSGQTLQLHVVVDLGASHALSLKSGAHEGIEIPDPSLATVLGRGVGGTIRGRLGRLERVQLGDQVLEDILVSFPDAAFQAGSGDLGRHGNLGSGFLKHFRVFFNYSEEALYLVPSSQFRRPFEYDMSGLILIGDPESDHLLVDEVLPGSPAADAGLQAGDILLEANGKVLTQAELETLRLRCETEGVRLRIRFQRGSTELVAEFRTRRLI